MPILMLSKAIYHPMHVLVPIHALHLYHSPAWDVQTLMSQYNANKSDYTVHVDVDENVHYA